VTKTDFVFAHLADAHVGAWSRDAAVRRALRETVLRALEVVEARDCEFLLVSGDLFHTPVPEPAEVAPVAAALRRLQSQGRRIYVIYGSHDYVAHRTSWLDVLAETGLFLKAAPDPVRAEGRRWSLRTLTDPGTGATIGGISGRAHGLDASYFRAVDSEALRASPGFKIFMFHAAVSDYLPSGLRGHVRGVARADLPGGCDYYAGGHIHLTYTGEGPDGGLLVNPGSVFGTSLTDLENAASGRSHQGLAVVTVRDMVPEVEFVDTGPRDRLRVFEVDVEGKTPEEARALLEESVAAQAEPGALLFPRVRGALADGGARALGLAESSARADRAGAVTVHWDLREVSHLPPEAPDAHLSEADVEAEEIHTLSSGAPAELPELAGDEGEARLRELLRELGTAKGDGEARHDYARQRLEAALRVLGVRTRRGGPRAPP
jgi:exonuclease SbcD